MILSAIHRPEVSFSEILTWKTCRMRWFWSYHLNLAPITAKRPLSVGRMGHVGLAAYLQGEDWNAAIDKEAEEAIKHMFQEDAEQLLQWRDTSKQLVTRYAQHYVNDRFKVLHVEVPFELKPRGLRNNRWIGYIDTILQDESGDNWLVEHKFPEQQFRSEEDMDLSTQIGMYQYIADRLGIKVIGTIYNQILAKLPATPKINMNGSISRSEIYCDWETYADFVVANGGMSTDYIADMFPKLAGKEFFRRHFIYRPKTQVALYREELEAVTWSLIAKRKHIFMSDNAINCRGCSYKELCMEKARGRDPQNMIDSMYQQKPPNTREVPSNVEENTLTQ